jgi:hypothetical protein
MGWRALVIPARLIVSACALTERSAKQFSFTQRGTINAKTWNTG